MSPSACARSYGKGKSEEGPTVTEGHYDVAQVCESGHVANSRSQDYPEFNSPHCAKCGAKTITTCPSCKAPIRGAYYSPGYLGLDHYEAPAYCHQCGSAYPWTGAALAAASELADVLDNLNGQDREDLKKTLGDLVRETPRSRVAETKFKTIMRKVGKEGYETMKSVLTDVVSETVRKTLFGA